MRKLQLFIVFLTVSFSLKAQVETFDSLNVELQQYKLTHPIKVNDKRVLNLLKNFYEQNLQTNKGLSEATLKEYYEINKSDSVFNKSVFFLFKKYQDYITETVAQEKPANTNFQIAVMKLLAGECIESYNKIPAIVLIYMGEALMSAGMQEEATEHFEGAIQFYPNSIPIQVYLVLLDEVKNKKLKRKLLKEQKDHWMVKSMLE